ncbi:glycoside hydrolase family 3 N-terminal domain-containing protein [Sphingomonas sp. RB3P16]|uniref:glycoside hydrolase family 3 protein n=1 Tax=Parasphingomonas frigoris TaxID=3096163 RepID=UPI002FC63CC3
MSAAPDQPKLSSQGVPLLQVDGRSFRDLDRNGRLHPYEDWRLAPSVRAADLVTRMTLAEKAGLMVIPVLAGNAPFGQISTGYDMLAAHAFVTAKHVSAFSAMTAMSIHDLAESANALQRETEASRLGIPALIVTDPRHGFQKTFGASVGTGGFSQWPDFTGLGALGDPAVVREYGDIVRRDYRAVGFALALSPQADLATEPRWPRINGTFGEDPATASAMVAAYITGVQGSASGVTKDGVASVVKHWVGYGAQRDGLDSHNYYGRFSALKPSELATHVRPFEAAFAVHVSGVMPAYSIFSDLKIGGRPAGAFGAGFSDVMIDGLLRLQHRFDGVVLSDWAITADCAALCHDGYPAGQRPGVESISTAWGVERLTRPQRFAKTILAGVDQIGGEPDPAPIVAAVEQGLVPVRRIDTAVTRILIQRFELGLFERPFVDVADAERIAGAPASHVAGRRAQARSMVMLEDRSPVRLIPGRTRLFLRGMEANAARTAGFEVVSRIEDADVAVIRLAAPYQTLHPGYFFGSMQHEGSLAFPADSADLATVRAAASKKPTIVDVYLDRPAILAPLGDLGVTLFASFGTSDAALLDVLSGKVRAEGRLPFELPSSMAAVETQDPGRPADSRAPLYPLHYRWRGVPARGVAPADRNRKGRHQ